MTEQERAATEAEGALTRLILAQRGLWPEQVATLRKALSICRTLAK